MRGASANRKGNTALVAKLTGLAPESLALLAH
ncbi:hypothetical protein ACV240_003105 [Klebsiella aerogenes]|nr:hypothetical protein [Klebsiella aerogenes]